ncbi:SAM hydrolase/SAM-dependent halogenase family protein [Pararhodospirillum photometricum]|uniref:SAM-dependent chlorinase/fluorinase n=1 Tax=Pararhodospirillum photometricum DSM 122 TaxID=1150469 RepID=H6SNA8_PARPM|nr:SAM-dependent chlorinase/fluorinase [Pararhodospirillum photometricum]CCG06984.1 Putative uncharacterized protein [Pararhodospirillum photometricum DSM 122]
MIFLATDFGLTGPYLGQVRAVLAQRCPEQAVIDLFADLPVFQPALSAPLLAAYTRDLPSGSLVLGVVDPDVGGERDGVILQADGLWFVGPDNGLFSLVARWARERAAWRLSVPPGASASFHGRDVFAPAAAILARGGLPEGTTVLDPGRLDRPDFPNDLPRIIYLDTYGNALTGIRASSLGPHDTLALESSVLPRARTFCDLDKGEPFCYRNANGLMEIAVNQGRADQKLALHLGTPVRVIAATAGVSVRG